MFEELDEMKSHLDSLRPIDPDKMAAIQQKLKIEWTYNSNAIEGNTLTLQETAFFLREGLTSKGKPLSQFLEAKDHVEAISFLEEVVHERKSLTERLIKDFHAIVMQDSKYVFIGPPENTIRKRVEPGKYKYDNNHVVKLDGTIHYYTDYLQVPGEMERLIGWYEENKGTMHPVELASRLHHKLVAIHPFTDGNGRVTRLVMNLILMQAGYEPAVIRNEDRMEYYEALDLADKGEYAPFISMVERETYRTMKMVVDVVEGREAFGKEDLKRMVKGFSEKVKKLDQDIGVVSKEVDDKIRIDNIEHIVDFFVSLANEIIHEPSSDEMRFTIASNDEAVRRVLVSKISHYCLENKKISVWWKKEDRHDKGLFEDHSEKGCGLEIELTSDRMYIPNAKLVIGVIPLTYKCTVVAFLEVPGIENDRAVLRLSDIEEKHIEVGNIWGDYDTKILEEFFVDTFKAFMKSVEQEVEKRRRSIAENENG